MFFSLAVGRCVAAGSRERDARRKWSRNRRPQAGFAVALWGDLDPPTGRPPGGELVAPGEDETRLVREDDRLDAVAELELHENVRNVCLHSRLADEQFLRDLSVGEAAGHQPQHLELAGGQLGE